MKHQTHDYFITLAMILIALWFTACGGSNQLIYQVAGAAGEAEVTYIDGDGNSHTETVTLPWETSFNVGSSANFLVTADNAGEQGNISCAVLLNDKELGRAEANYYAGCRGSFKKSGGGLSVNFSSNKDVLPDGSAAGPQATATPVPPTATPDLTADFVSYTTEEGFLSLQHPPGWLILEEGDMIAALSDESLAEAFLRNEDYSQPAGFVVGRIGPTHDFDSDDPAVLLEEWLAQVEDDDWQPEPAGELDTATNGTIRRASRAFTGNKDGQELYFTITGIVNGASAGIFVGGRTGTAPEEHGVLATAILDTLELEYLDPQSVAEAVEPTTAPMPTRAATVWDVFADKPFVFASDRDGDFEIYLYDIGARDLPRLTEHDAFDGQPAWSPDGTKIAFVSDRDGNQEIYTMNADGSDVTRLTNDPANDYSPAWSPNGQIIAFMSDRSGKYNIFLMHADGSGLSPLLSNNGKNMSPAWSHTTQELAFVSDQAEEGVFDLYITNDKGQTRRVTQGIGKVFAPDWSSNGRFIAFANENGNNFDIYIIKPDGTDLQQVTNDKAKDYLPKWSPDNNYIMFVSERDGSPDIYVTNEAGEVQQVTTHYGTDTSPWWRPVKKK